MQRLEDIRVNIRKNGQQKTSQGISIRSTSENPELLFKERRKLKIFSYFATHLPVLLRTNPPA
jgi:hypothetical protein